MLPKGKLSTQKVELSGGEVEIRSLTLSQSRVAGVMTGEDRIIAAIAFAIAEGIADVSPPEKVLESATADDVRVWLETAPAGDATKLLNAITEVSGLSAEAQFPQ